MVGFGMADFTDTVTDTVSIRIIIGKGILTGTPEIFDRYIVIVKG